MQFVTRLPVLPLFALTASAAPVVPFFYDAEVTYNGLALLQHSAERSSSRLEREAGIKLGNSVGITETGYQVIANLNSDEEMKAFIHRVVEKEARYINDVAELSGFVQYYSGTQNVQTLDIMKKELRNAAWVSAGEGRNAELSEVGYQKVAKLRSKPHMMAFVRRILDSDFKKSSDEGALNGLLPYYDGELSVQSFAQLKHELLSAPWAVWRDDEQALLGNAPQVSFSEHASAVQADKADERVEESKPKKEEILTAEKKEGCDDWCSGDLFVKVEANTTVLKNLSSWAIKCDWAHCSGCSDCNDPSARSVEKKEQKLEMSHDKKKLATKGPSCEDWCSSESFQVVKLNTTRTKEFSWEMKCEWQYCGGCSKCTPPQHVDHPVSMRKVVASESSQKSSEDPEEEEVVETTLATTTTAATTTAATTTLATTTLATTTLATTTLATTTLATTTVLTTVVTTTLPTTTLPEEVEEVDAEVELLEEEHPPTEEEKVKNKDHSEGKDGKHHSNGKDEEPKSGEMDDKHAKGDKNNHDLKQEHKTEKNKEHDDANKTKKHGSERSEKKGETAKNTTRKEEAKSDDSGSHGVLSWLFR